MPKRARESDDEERGVSSESHGGNGPPLTNGNAIAGPSRLPASRTTSDEKDELEWYTSHLDSHILASKLQYQGESPSAYAGDYYGRHATLVGPKRGAGWWTPEDKALFFAALARHSRLRPDLISSACGKPQHQVLWYLDTLERGDQRLRQWDSSRHGARDRYDTWRKSRRSRIGLAPSAREVGGEWVEEEERLATALITSLEEREGALRSGELELERGREKREMFKREMKAAGVKRKRDLPRRQAVKQELEDKWAAEDWGSELDSGKLQKLRPVIHDIAGTPALLVNGQGPGKEAGEVKEEVVGVTRTVAKIQHDEIRLARLEEIPKKDRSAEEKAEMREIKNRTRMRHAKRRLKLLEKGCTQEDLLRLGVDALFAQVFEGQTPYSTKETVALPIAVPGLVADMGLDVLNVDHIRQCQEMISSQPPNLSLEILEELVFELRTFLTCLVYQTIMVAEQAQRHNGDTSDDSSDSSSSSASSTEDSRQGVSSSHVAQALALRSTPHPRTIIHSFLSRLGSLVPTGPVDFPLPSRPPSNLPWAGMRISNPSPPVSSKSSTVDPEEMPSTEGEEGEGLTDMEEQELDEALEELDEACDEKLALVLTNKQAASWEGAWDDPWKEGKIMPSASAASTVDSEVEEDGEQKEDESGEEERGDAFERARRSEFLPLYFRSDSLSTPHLAPLVKPQAEAEYTRLLFSITRARRDRSSRAWQREKHASQSDSRRKGRTKSRDFVLSDDDIFIVDSESDDDEDDQDDPVYDDESEDEGGNASDEDDDEDENEDEDDKEEGRAKDDLTKRKSGKRPRTASASEEDIADDESEEEGRRSDGWGPGSSADPSSDSDDDGEAMPAPLGGEGVTTKALDSSDEGTDGREFTHRGRKRPRTPK